MLLVSSSLLTACESLEQSLKESFCAARKILFASSDALVGLYCKATCLMFWGQVSCLFMQCTYAVTSLWSANCSYSPANQVRIKISKIFFWKPRETFAQAIRSWAFLRCVWAVHCWTLLNSEHLAAHLIIQKNFFFVTGLQGLVIFIIIIQFIIFWLTKYICLI